MSVFTKAQLLGLLLWTTASLAAVGQIPKPIDPRLGSVRPSAKHPAVSYPAGGYQPTDRSSPVAGDLQRLRSTPHGALARPAGQTLPQAYPQLQFTPDAGAVLVRITGQDINALLPTLAARGFVVKSSYPELHFVEGYLPLTELDAGGKGVGGLTRQGLMGVRPIYRPLRHAGLVTSGADHILEADRVRATLPGGYDGTGIRIGVMSDSFNALKGAAADVTSGDLPANVQVLQEIPDLTKGTDEGRAMCQLIHDLAPGAQLAFSSINSSEGDYAQQIRNLADPTKGNCKVLTDDISFLDEPFFQDGVVAQAVNEVVTQRGVTYFAAAGNSGTNSYETTTPTFVPVGSQGDAQLNFSTTGAPDVAQRFTVPQGEEVQLELQWADPFYTAKGVKTDLDMYLISSKGDTVAASGDDNVRFQTPSEFFDFTNDTTRTHTTTFDLYIVRFRGTPNPTRLKYVNSGSVTASEWLTNSGTIVGHASAAQAQAVAAAGYYNQRTVEEFSSVGSPTILFSPTGTLLTAPETRPKPNITSTDGTNTTFFGSPDFEGDGYPNFFGTSAAAPQAAAVGALIQQALPALTPAQVYERLSSTARDINTAGFDNATGAGLIDAYTAIYGPAVVAAVPLTQDFESKALPQTWMVSNYLAGRAQVRTDQGPAGGTAHLVLSAAVGVLYPSSRNPTSYSSLSQAILYTSAAGIDSSFVLTFKEKEFPNETDNVLPTQFTGNSPGDGVSLSVNGGSTWYRLVNLTGTTSTTTYQNFSVNLTRFARANNLTLGNDVRIKFQQYGGGRPEATVAAQQGGIAFDDVSLTGVLTVVATSGKVDLQLWPNPVRRGSLFTLELPAQPASTLRLIDVLGRLIWQQSLPATNATTRRTLPVPLAAGVYSLLYQPTSGSSSARRIIVE